MPEVHVKSEDWRAVAQALTGEDTWTYGVTLNGYQDYTHGIPTTKWERREYTLGGFAVTEVSFYALRMVGNGHMLEELKSMEVELRLPDVVRMAKHEGREGLFVASDSVDVRGRLRGFEPTRKRRPQLPAEDMIRMNKILAREVEEPPPAPSTHEPPAPPPGVGYAYVCRYGHVNDEVERDPINDAFFCIECGVEIE